jgi:hypothetical protein
MNLYIPGPWGISGADVLLITIGLVAVVGTIHFRFFRKW